MDDRKFDRLTRLFGTPGSRRTAFRALLGAALLGTTTRAAMATSSNACDPGKNEVCGKECCPGTCFVRTCSTTEEAFCCTGERMIICGIDQRAQCCVDDGRPNPCEDCLTPSVGGFCPSYVGGSYRRR
jgi:hypothetical protein